VSKQPKTEKQADVSFEEAFAQLESIVEKLEGGALSLDESLQLFERGQRLAAYCGARLDEAELKIQQLTLGPDGSTRLSPLADREGD
jgi:exodeoxyribonuclease VII small subunit